MIQNSDSTPSLSVLRIYLRRRGSRPTVKLDYAAFVVANGDELADAVHLPLDGINVSLRGIPA